MRNQLTLTAIIGILVVAGSSSVPAQTTPQQPAQGASAEARAADRVRGEVAAVEPGSRKLVVRTDTGQSYTVNVDEKTAYRRIPPGETSVEKATVIAFSDIGVGDRVLARGKLDAETMQARIVLVVSKAELTRSEERSRAEWQQRGISGTIVSVNPEAKELMVRLRAGAPGAPLRVTVASNNVRIKRYAPGSIRYSDARPSAFNELKVGDQIRALGDRSPDGASFKPEEIVAGSFRMAGGTITSVNPATGEIIIRDIQTRQPLTIVVNKDSMLRRLPPELLARMESTMQQAAPAGELAAGGEQEIRVMTATGPAIRRFRRLDDPSVNPQPGGQPAGQPGGQTGNQPAGQPGQPPAGATTPGTPGAPGTPGNGQSMGGPGMRRVIVPPGTDPAAVLGSMPAGTPMPGGTQVPGGAPVAASGANTNNDFQDAIEKLPAITLADLKPGEAILVSSTGSDDPSRAMAITVAAGVESFLKRQEQARSTRPNYQLDLTLPGLGAP